MNKIKIFILLGLMSILLVGAGCNKDVHDSEEIETDSTETEAREKNWMTKEYIIEHGLATEEDLEGVDVESMVCDCEWEQGLEEKQNIALMIAMLKRGYMYDEYVFSYQYLVDAKKAKDELTEEDMKTVKTIGFAYNEGTYYESIIVDLSEKIIYFGDGEDLLKRGAIPTKERELSDEEIEAIKELMILNNVASWKYNYGGNQVDDTTGWFWWELYYELEDGRIYMHDGFGASGESTPDNYDSFVEGLGAFLKD